MCGRRKRFLVGQAPRFASQGPASGGPFRISPANRSLSRSVRYGSDRTRRIGESGPGNLAYGTGPSGARRLFCAKGGGVAIMTSGKTGPENIRKRTDSRTP
ncbi:hypothetical protein SBA4_2690006 [Candidatus Sulfopaludibacter sp. SbA4]|nr:hypothetical protein SBA4_2690006 [Candidatus Sulfopaludibacter sp. SbA4]